MYKHRLATFDDLETVLEMGERFHMEFVAPFWPIDYDYDSAALKTMPLLEEGLVMVTMEVEHKDQEEGPIVGMAAMEYINYAFNMHVKIANEVVLWLNPEHRGNRLAAEMIAVLGIGVSEDDCEFIAMTALEQSPDHVDGIYKMLGLKPFETKWLRKVQKIQQEG